MKKLILFALSVVMIGTANAQSNETTNTVKENPVIIGNQRGFTVSKANLALDPVLRMPEANNGYIITGYQISYLPKDGGREIQGPFVIKGNQMNAGVAADILNKVQPGDRIYFEEIVAVSADASKKPLKLSAAVTVE